MLDRVHNAWIARVEHVVLQIAAQHDILGEIGHADALVDRGMTSMAMVDLMLALEVEFDTTLPPHALTPANFKSIDSLAAMLSAR